MKKMPMVDLGDEHKGNNRPHDPPQSRMSAVAKDAKSGSGMGPHGSVKEASGGGWKGGRMSKAVSTLKKMAE